jgi:hypothetical protein
MSLNRNTFQAVLVGSNGDLWLEHAPFGELPPKRQQVDGNVHVFPESVWSSREIAFSN